MGSSTSLHITDSGDDTSQSRSNISHLEEENLIPNMFALLLKVVKGLCFIRAFTKQNNIIYVTK